MTIASPALLNHKSFAVFTSKDNMKKQPGWFVKDFMMIYNYQKVRSGTLAGQGGGLLAMLKKMCLSFPSTSLIYIV